jgi:hypothetical protein
MRPEELAAVGQNVNQQGGAVTESSIQVALDAEIDEERKATIARNKARQNKARIADTETKAAIKQRGVDAIGTSVAAGLTLAAAKMDDGSDDPDDPDAPDAPKSEQVSARAEKAGARGNVVKQAKLQDRSAGLKGKEDIRMAAQQTKLNQKTARRQPRVDARAASQQKRLDEYKLKQEYGGDRSRGSYRTKGSLYSAQPDTSADIFNPDANLTQASLRAQAGLSPLPQSAPLLKPSSNLDPLSVKGTKVDAARQTHLDQALAEMMSK